MGYCKLSFDLVNMAKKDMQRFLECLEDSRCSLGLVLLFILILGLW